jgi:hypothetical protein
VVGDDLFWLTLHDHAAFYGHTALQHYREGYRIRHSDDLLPSIQPDMVICRPDLPDQAELCALAADYFGTEPEPFTITMGTFMVYRR